MTEDSDELDRPQADHPYARAFRCGFCMTEKGVSLVPNWRQQLAEGEQLAEQRCQKCGGLMELIGPLLDP